MYYTTQTRTEEKIQAALDLDTKIAGAEMMVKAYAYSSSPKAAAYKLELASLRLERASKSFARAAHNLR